MGPYSARDLAQHIVNERKKVNDTVTPLQLMKLVYLCHGWVLGTFGRPLVKETFEAWEYGPVSKDLYSAIREYRSSPVDHVPKAKAIDLTDEERGMISEVVDFYAKFDGIRLSALTHEAGSPWHRTWLMNGKNSPISNDLIENFYSSLAENDAVAA